MQAASEGMMTVEAFATMKGLQPSKVIAMIQEGFYVGRKVGEEWFVDLNESVNSAGESSKFAQEFLF